MERLVKGDSRVKDVSRSFSLSPSLKNVPVTIIAPELCTINSLRVAKSTANGTKAKRTPQRAKMKRAPFILLAFLLI